MSARYTIVQYVPDPIAEERINVGVITWDQERIRCRFLNNWSRVRSFGGEGVDFLRDFAKDIAETTSRQMRLAGVGAGEHIDVPRLEKMVREWGRSIQFSAARGSLKDADSLLDDIAPLFLRERILIRAQPRTRVAAARVAATILLDAVRKRAPEEAEQLVKKNATIDGVIEPHRFDVVLGNGRPLAAVHAISFEINEGEHLEKEVLMAKWTLADVRSKYPKLPLAVFALPPATPSVREIYKDTTQRLTALDTRVISSPTNMARWATERAQALRI